MNAFQKAIPPEIIAGTVTMLSTYIPGLTPDSLQAALGNINNTNASSDKDARPQKPYTRKEAAEMLGVSVPSIDRYMADGRLTRVRYSARAIRISAESVHKLMANGAA